MLVESSLLPDDGTRWNSEYRVPNRAHVRSVPYPADFWRD